MASSEDGRLCYRVGNETAPVDLRESVGQELASLLDVPAGTERELTRADLPRLDSLIEQHDDEVQADLRDLRREVQLAGRVTLFRR